MDANLPILPDHPRVVIIGGGFAGLALAKKLRKQPIQIAMLDRNNYYTFQPLLYQVATGGLEPDSIAYPLRKIFQGNPKFSFRMTDVLRINPEEKQVETSIGTISYDHLVVATGSQTNFFNFADQEEHMMGLKSVPEALNLRSYILQNFEKATTSANHQTQDSLINVNGYDGLYILGDAAAMITPKTPRGYPMMAPVAIQQGQQLGMNLIRTRKGQAWKPFKYFDKGTMATIGRNRAVVNFLGQTFHGLIAWLMWMFVHIMYLVGFRNKVATLMGWVYNYLTYDRALRLIIRPFAKNIRIENHDKIQ